VLVTKKFAQSHPVIELIEGAECERVLEKVLDIDEAERKQIEATALSSNDGQDYFFLLLDLYRRFSGMVADGLIKDPGFKEREQSCMAELKALYLYVDTDDSD